MPRSGGLAHTDRHLLVSRREQLGLSRADLAEHAGVSFHVIRHVEEGRQDALSVGATKRVALVLGVTMERLTVLVDEAERPVRVPGRPSAPAGAA